MTCTNTDPNGGIVDSGCFTFPEGTFVGTNECVDCGGARRCVDTTAHLLCPDNELVINSQCSPSTQEDPTLVLNNHVVRWTETCFADGSGCWACPLTCVVRQQLVVRGVCRRDVNVFGRCVFRHSPSDSPITPAPLGVTVHSSQRTRTVFRAETSLKACVVQFKRVPVLRRRQSQR